MASLKAASWDIYDVPWPLISIRVGLFGATFTCIVLQDVLGNHECCLSRLCLLLDSLKLFTMSFGEMFLKDLSDVEIKMQFWSCNYILLVLHKMLVESKVGPLNIHNI